MASYPIEEATATIDGRTYRFKAYPLGAYLPTQPGIYMFTQRQTWGTDINYAVRYVGQAHRNLRERITPSHEKWHCASNLGFDFILVIVEHNPHRRNELECIFYKTYDPPCNDINPPDCS